MDTKNLKKILNETVKFGTKSRFKGLASFYITSMTLCILIFFLIHILSTLKPYHDANTNEFLYIIGLTIIAVGFYSQFFKLAKKLNNYNTKFFLILMCYINLSLVVLPENLDHLFKYLKRNDS